MFFILMVSRKDMCSCGDPFALFGSFVICRYRIIVFWATFRNWAFDFSTWQSPNAPLRSSWHSQTQDERDMKRKKYPRGNMDARDIESNAQMRAVFTEEAIWVRHQSGKEAQGAAPFPRRWWCNRNVSAVALAVRSKTERAMRVARPQELLALPSINNMTLTHNAAHTWSITRWPFLFRQKWRRLRVLQATSVHAQKKKINKAKETVNGKGLIYRCFTTASWTR